MRERGRSRRIQKNVRAFSLDDVVPEYGLTSREIFQRMQRATHATGIRHPLHLHMNNLGLPGNVETALATIDASQGLRLHLAHVQFTPTARRARTASPLRRRNSPRRSTPTRTSRSTSAR